MSSTISIITPVYNEEENILECYRRLLNQDYKNIEWVIIDDGSTDASLDKIKIIIDDGKMDVKLFAKSNEGAAIARRYGIERAKGDYIVSLDADDYLSNDALCLAMCKISEYVDLCCFDLKVGIKDGEYQNFKYQIADWPVKGEDAFHLNLDGWKVAGLFLTKKNIILKAYEMYNIINNNVNDDEVISRLCMLNSNFIELCDGVYHYEYNQLSTTKKVNNNYYKIIYTALFLNEFVHSYYPEYKDDVLRGNISVLYEVYRRFVKFNNEVNNKREWVKALSLLNGKLVFTDLAKQRVGFENKFKKSIKLLIVKLWLAFNESKY